MLTSWLGSTVSLPTPSTSKVSGFGGVGGRSSRRLQALRLHSSVSICTIMSLEMPTPASSAYVVVDGKPLNSLNFSMTS